MNRTCLHFFDDIDRISHPKYEPTDLDILRQCRPTTGIIEQYINVKDHPDMKFLLVDTGGQKNERKKWIHHFQNVSAIVYVASLSAFDEPLYEDETINSLLDSIELFGDLMNTDNEWFRKCKFFLIFNKKDIFQQKLEKQSLKICFGDKYDEKKYYTDCGTIEDKVDNNVRFIKSKFMEKCGKTESSKEVTTFVISAVDEEYIKTVYDMIFETLVGHNENGEDHHIETKILNQMSDSKQPLKLHIIGSQQIST